MNECNLKMKKKNTGKIKEKIPYTKDELSFVKIFKMRKKKKIDIK